MAESAVNISSIHHKKPNIFELVAQESFMDHISPSIKALVFFAADKNTTIFGPLLKWYEECFLSVNFVLQYYYLKAFNASFSEAFYGLRRIKAFSENVKSKLPPKVFAASLFFLVITPYLNNKLNQVILHYEEEQISGKTANIKRLERLLRLKKVVKTTHGVLKLYYLISYTAGFSPVHDPLLRLSGVWLICHDRNFPSWKDILNALLMRKGHTPKVTLKLFLKLFASTLEIGAFFIQFLNWWHSDESKASLTQLPVPKPPHIGNGTDTCPICLKKRRNEVALLTSGYVFCYLCIKDYLNSNSMCPITQLPSTSDNLVRIYSAD